MRKVEFIKQEAHFVVGRRIISRHNNCCYFTYQKGSKSELFMLYSCAETSSVYSYYFRWYSRRRRSVVSLSWWRLMCIESVCFSLNKWFSWKPTQLRAARWQDRRGRSKVVIVEATQASAEAKIRLQTIQRITSLYFDKLYHATQCRIMPRLGFISKSEKMLKALFNSATALLLIHSFTATRQDPKRHMTCSHR